MLQAVPFCSEKTKRSSRHSEHSTGKIEQIPEETFMREISGSFNRLVFLGTEWAYTPVLCEKPWKSNPDPEIRYPSRWP
jgi:hypothetical protein